MSRYHARPTERTLRNLTLTLSVVAVVAPPPVSASVASGDDQPQFSWEHLDSGTEAFITSLDAVSSEAAWTAGFEGLVLRTVDGGATFPDVSPPDVADVNFLDVEASSTEDALLLGVGPTSESIYRTADGGETWSVAFVTSDAFFTSISMFNRRHGFAVGDPIDGKFQILVTSDAGRSWEPVDPAGMPAAVEGEFGIAFTGNSSAATGHKAFFGTAFGTEGGRVFRSSDRGLTWEVSTTPMAGVTALDFRTNRLGLAVNEGISRSTDGGVSWQLVDEAPTVFSGDVAWWSDKRGDERSAASDAQRTAFTDTSYVTRDRGKTWEQFAEDDFSSVDCAEDTEACWAVGESGMIARLVVS